MKRIVRVEYMVTISLIWVAVAPGLQIAPGPLGFLTVFVQFVHPSQTSFLKDNGNKYLWSPEWMNGPVVIAHIWVVPPAQPIPME